MHAHNTGALRLDTIYQLTETMNGLMMTLCSTFSGQYVDCMCLAFRKSQLVGIVT